MGVDSGRVSSTSDERAKAAGPSEYCGRNPLDASHWSAVADVPEEFGNWSTIWDLFDAWNANGILDEIVRRLQAAHVDVGEIDQELWCIDGTIVRAARCAAGGGKKATPRSLATTP